MMTWNSMFFNSPSSNIMEIVSLLHDYIMMFLMSTMILVILIMAYSFVSKSFSMNFQEDNKLEFLWTILPFLILSFIVIPSLFSLYMLDSCIFCGLTFKIMGNQWYWTYEYYNLNNVSFNSYMENSSNTNIRLLEVDNSLIVPCMIPIRFLVSSNDVIHSWTVPSFGLKMDAVPGRINQFCVMVKRVGTFFGQCSEICGANHSFMPIVLESVNFKSFLDLMNK